MSDGEKQRIETKPGRDTRLNRMLYGFFRQVVSNSLRIYTRGTVEGKENLPGGAFILAPVHRSYIDTPISSWVQLRRMRYLGKNSMWKNPMWIQLNPMMWNQIRFFLIFLRQERCLQMRR